jgi:thioredoxin-like negative regulator of GroEL
MARQRGDLPSAEQLLSQALEQDPENHRIHPELAQLLLDLGDYDRAGAILKKLRFFDSFRGDPNMLG